VADLDVGGSATGGVGGSVGARSRHDADYLLMLFVTRSTKMIMHSNSIHLIEPFCSRTPPFR
jgi:hypothetical protein